MTEAPKVQKQAKQAAYNKNEKSKDIRSTNIQAAKGIKNTYFSCRWLYQNQSWSKRHG